MRRTSTRLHCRCSDVATSWDTRNTSAVSELQATPINLHPNRMRLDGTRFEWLFQSRETSWQTPQATDCGTGNKRPYHRWKGKGKGKGNLPPLRRRATSMSCSRQASHSADHGFVVTPAILITNLAAYSLHRAIAGHSRSKNTREVSVCLAEEGRDPYISTHLVRPRHCDVSRKLFGLVSGSRRHAYTSQSRISIYW